MANAFGDQFLKAGLVSKSRLDKARKSRNKQQKQKQKQKIEVVEEAAVAARQAAAGQAARRRQKEEAGRREIQAQVRQLVELNRLPRDHGEVDYNFQDGTAIRKILVTEEIRDKLGRGLLAIARFDDGYEVIPSVVAEKIMLREASCIVSNKPTQQEHGEDDPYADYKVPDDLTW